MDRHVASGEVLDISVTRIWKLELWCKFGFYDIYFRTYLVRIFFFIKYVTVYQGKVVIDKSNILLYGGNIYQIKVLKTATLYTRFFVLKMQLSIIWKIMLSLTQVKTWHQNPKSAFLEKIEKALIKSSKERPFLINHFNHNTLINDKRKKPWSKYMYLTNQKHPETLFVFT